MVNIPEIVHPTDTYNVWREKTNAAFGALVVLADFIDGSLALEDQFKFAPTPNNLTIRIRKGKVRNRNDVSIVPQTDLVVGDGFLDYSDVIYPNDMYNLSFPVVANDPDFAVFLDGELYTNPYTLDPILDTITFSIPPTGTKLAFVKNNKRIIAINNNGLSPVVDVYDANAVPLNNIVPIYSTLSLFCKGFTGTEIPVWSNYLQNGAVVSAIYKNNVVLDVSEYSVSEGTGIVTFSTALVADDEIKIYGVAEDKRTWAVAAVDTVSDDSTLKFEWATQITGSPTTIIDTTISDQFIGNIGVYVDGLRKSSAVGYTEYSVSSVGGFIRLTFNNAVAVNSNILVVVNEDAHQISSNPIVIEYPSNPTPNDTFDFSLDFTESELSIYPTMEKFIAVYVAGVRQSYSSFSITGRNIVTLDVPVANSDVMIVVNEPNGLDGISALIEGGNAGDIIYRTVDSIRWGAPEFDASAIISGTISPNVLPIATPKQALDGVSETTLMTPALTKLTQNSVLSNNWTPCKVGSNDDYWLTDFSTYVDATDNQYIATRNGRIFKGITSTNGFDLAYVRNAPFGNVNAISCTHDDYPITYPSLVVVGDKGKIAIWGQSHPKWKEYTLLDFPAITGVDNTWNCIDVEATFRLDGFGHTFVVLLENQTKTAWKLCTFNNGFVGLPDNNVVLTYGTTLESSPAVKPVIGSHLYLTDGARYSSGSLRLQWFVGNVYKYYMGNMITLNTATLTTIAGQNVIDFVTWDTSNGSGGAFIPNGESAGANGSGITYGALLTDTGTVAISAQNNSNGTPYYVNGTIFSDAVIDATFQNICPNGIDMGVFYDTMLPTSLGRRIVALSKDNYSTTTTHDDNESSFNVKPFGSSFLFPLRKIATPTHSQLFNGTTKFYPTIIQNELADTTILVADEGVNEKTNHSVVIGGTTKAFTSANSPAPPVPITKVVSNGNVTISLAKSPFNIIWRQNETNDGGVTIPFVDEIIDIFCEGYGESFSLDSNVFFAVSATKIYYSKDGIEWKNTPHGITIGSGNGVYEASSCEDYTNSPTVVAHYTLLIDGKLVYSRNNNWATFNIQPFTVYGSTLFFELCADIQYHKLYLLASADNDIYEISYNSLGLGTPSHTINKTGTFNAIQYSKNFKGVIAVENNGAVWYLDSFNSASWVQLSALTVDGSSVAVLQGSIVKLTGKTILMARYANNILASSNGVDWATVVKPSGARNPEMSQITHDGGSTYFITETQLNIPTGNLPTYYKVIA